MRYLIMVMLFALCPLACAAQKSGDADSKKDEAPEELEAKKLDAVLPPKKSTIRAIGDDPKVLVEYLRAVCSDARVKEGRAECGSCPKEIEKEPEYNLTARSGYVGDFSGKGHEEAILRTSSCGGGWDASNIGLMLALRKTKQGWKRITKFHSLGGDNCTPIHTPHRDMLLCKISGTSGGYTQTILSHYFFENDTLNREVLTDELFDQFGSLKFEGKVKYDVELQVIDDIDGDGNIEIALGLVTVIGTPKGKSLADYAGCDGEDDWECTNAAEEEESNYKFTKRKSLEVWEVTSKGVRKDPSAAKSTKHPKLIPYK